MTAGIMIVRAILAIYPYMSRDNRACIERNQTRIGAQLDAAHAASPNVPKEVIAAVAFKETHLGCDEADWGAPIDSAHRHTPGTHLHAARALDRSFAVCGSVEGAVTRFRTGLCDSRRSSSPLVARQGVAYWREVRRLAHRIEAVLAGECSG